MRGNEVNLRLKQLDLEGIFVNPVEASTELPQSSSWSEILGKEQCVTRPEGEEGALEKKIKLKKGKLKSLSF